MRGLGYVEAFARHGVELVNPQWAVSAIAEDGALVVSCWRTVVSEAGRTECIGYDLGTRGRLTRAVRWEPFSEEAAYDPEQLDRHVQTPDQIRTLIRIFRDKLPEIYPGRPQTWRTFVAKSGRELARKVAP